jgi:hypothetical protein
MMPHFGKDNSITFFFKQNGPVSQFLSMWQNFSTIISQRDQGTDRQANSGSNLISFFFNGDKSGDGACGGVVVKALHYKPAGCGFDS